MGRTYIVSDPPRLVDENYLIVRNGENFIQINKDKISRFECKREGVIVLFYENDFGSPLFVQIEAEQDPEGFEAALGYMKELETDYTTDITGGGELTFDKIKQYYAPNFNQENVQAFSVKYPSSAGNQYSIWQLLPTIKVKSRYRHGEVRIQEVSTKLCFSSTILA